LSRFSLSYSAKGLIESLLYVVLNISKRKHSISKRHNKKKESEDLTKSPNALLATLITLVALKRQLSVDNEEDIDGYEGRKANIEKCSTNSGVRMS
jgi:hypothetical protein